MKQLLGGAAIVWLAVLACSDDGGVTSVSSTPSEAGAGGGGEGGQGGGPAEVPPGGAGGRTEPEPEPEAGAGGVEPAGGAAGTGGAGGAPLVSDVTGRVRASGAPAAGVAVLIDGRSLVTDEEGSFSLTGVGETYDLMVIDEDRYVVEIHEGLTTRTPLVTLFTPLPPPTPHTATVEGALSGASIPVPAAHVGAVAYSDNETGAYRRAVLAPSGDAYSLSPIAWGGPAPRSTGMLLAMTWKGAAAGPTEFTGLAHRDLTLENGDALLTSLLLSDPSERAVQIELAVPSGADLESTELAIGPIWIPLQLPSGSSSVVTPVAPGVPVGILARLGYEDGRSITLFEPRPASGVWTLEPRVPADLGLPVNDAKGVDTETEFSTGNIPSGGVHAFTWTFSYWMVTRVTKSSVTTLPDLTAQGIVFDNDPDGVVLNLWSVEVLGPATSPDEYQLAEDAFRRNDGARSYWSSQSEARSFLVAE